MATQKLTIVVGFAAWLISLANISCRAKLEGSDLRRASPDNSCQNVEFARANGEVCGEAGTLASAVKLRMEGCLDPDLLKVVDTEFITLCDGTQAAGKLKLDGSKQCSSDGEVGCITGSRYKAADTTAIASAAAKIHTTISIAGVAGKLVNCGFNSSGCYLGEFKGGSQPLKAIDFTSITPGILKSSSNIAGVIGAYPSATYPLAEVDGVNDLDTATFDAQIKSSADFGWFDRAGARHVHAGDSDIDATKIETGVNIFGAEGTYSGILPDPWDLRAGVSVGVVSGKLKANCRNGGNTGLVDISMPKLVTNISGSILTVTNHGFSSNDRVRVSFSTAPTGLNAVTTYYVIAIDQDTFQVSTVSGPGGAVTITGSGTNVTVFLWNDGTLGETDTIDDFNGDGSAAISAHPWSSNTYFCSGVEASAGDDNVWKDVTTGGCDGTKCRYKDKISGLEWSKTQSTSAPWGKALNICSTLTHDGVGGWRLPTQKELMDGYAHGIHSAANANWITAAQMMPGAYFWSSPTVSFASGNAWYVELGSGSTYNNTRSGGSHVACVR
jgi:hypothetical protein